LRRSGLFLRNANRNSQRASRTRDFEARYLRIVGPRYAELDELEAQIAEAIARLDPRDEHAQAEADRARSQADESAEASQSARHGSETCKFAGSEVLKKLRREAARLIHPDRDSAS
jgi:hypothetical protein